MKKTIVLILLLCPLMLKAQFTLSGTVLDEGNEPLTGVSIQVRNSNKGTLTNMDGKFTIDVRKNNTLILSYLGYTTLEVKVLDEKPLTLIMKEDTKHLDEVVVVGYGEFKRQDITGSVAELDMTDIIKAPVPTFDQALAGRIAGVQVSSDDAQPGTEMNIVIRGANSLTQDNSPLFVVDGFPMEDFNFSSLSPSDIASLNILKDASATAIYGARGANGVIIIETKKGQIGKPVITYEGSYGFQQATKHMDLMNPYEFVAYQTERASNMIDKYLTNPGLTLEDYRTMPNIDWQDKLMRNAPLLTQGISISGGSEKTRYLMSGTIVDQEGIIINSGYNKYQIRMRVDQTLSSKLKAGLNINYTKDKNYGQVASEQGNSANAYSTYLMYRVWGYQPVNIGETDIEEELFSDDEFGSTALLNPIVSTQNEFREEKKSFLTANLTLDYAILSNLTLKIRGGINNRLTQKEAFNNSKTYRGYPSVNNTKGVNASMSEQDRQSWTNENLLTYRKSIDKENRLDITAGMTLESMTTSNYGFSTILIPNEELGMFGMNQGVPYSASSTKYERSLMSYLGRINYYWKSKYTFTACMRADGSSRFAKENRWGYFPSGAIAWNLNKESFMKRMKFISGAKLRTSYGITGNDKVSDNARYAILDITNYYSFDNGTPQYALSLKNLSNDNLRWETTHQFDLGLDLSLFKNRINLTVDAYLKKTNDLLLNAKVPYSSGTTTSYKNVGKIENKGLEFSINTTNIKKKDFSWSSNFNIAFNRSKVLALSDGEETLLSSVSWTGDWNAKQLYMAKVGQPVSAFYGYVWEGNYQYEDFDLQPDGSYLLKQNISTNGNTRNSIKPGDIKYVDQNNDGIVNDQDRVVIGSPLPIHIGGFNNNLTYKDFGLNIFFQWSYGNDVFNANRILMEGNETNRSINQYATYSNRWTEDNQNNEYYRIGGYGPRGVYSSRTVEDGSFLRLKTVQLSYNVPQRFIAKTGIKNANLYLSGQNLYTWTSYSGMDPEVSVRNSTLTPGFDYSAYARNRNFTLGIKLTL